MRGARRLNLLFEWTVNVDSASGEPPCGYLESLFLEAPGVKNRK